MLALAGLPLGLRVPVPRPLAGRTGPRGGRARRRRRTTIRRRSGSSPPARRSSRTSSRTCRSRRRAPSAPLPPPLALELGQDRLVEKQLFQRLGIPTARFGSLADSGLPALVKSRRLGYDGKGQRRVGARRGARRARAGRGDRPLRPRAVDHRRPRSRRRDALLAAHRERAPRRHPAHLAIARRRRTAGGGRGARAPAPRGARTTSACSRSSCSRSTAGCSRTSSHRASTTRATGRSTARSRASSRTTCGRSSACRSGRPTRSHRR